MAQTSRNEKLVKAGVEKVYRAFTTAAALEAWLAPENMDAKVQDFDFSVGGGYTMVLHYPQAGPGKTSAGEDRYTARFVEIVPNHKITIAIHFDSADEKYKGEMIMRCTLEAKPGGTNVVIAFENIPAGISAKDNEAGTESSLTKLAQYVAL